MMSGDDVHKLINILKRVDKMEGKVGNNKPWQQVATAAGCDAAQGVVMPEVAMAAASDDVQGVLMPDVDMADASDTVQGVVMPDVSMAVASDTVQGVVMPDDAVAAASDTVQGVVMPDISMAVASDTVQGVVMPDDTVAAASDTVQGVVMPDVAMAAASDTVQGVTIPKTTAPAVSTCSKAAQKVAMPDITEFITSDDFQGVNTPKIALPAASDAVCPVSTMRNKNFLQNPATALKKLFVMGELDNSCLEGKIIRQLEPAHLNEKSEDIGGHWGVADSIAACTGCTPKLAWRWVNRNIDRIKEIAPSLAFIDVEHTSVSFITSTQIYTRIYTCRI